jgi:hypothetical protein
LAHRHSKDKRYRKFKQFEERMAEKDTANSIVKGLSIHNSNGDIIFHTDNLSEINLALMAGKYCIEKHRLVTKRGKLRQRTDRYWYDIDVEVADGAVEGLVNGQVLNRFSEPCWWRS